MDASAASSSTQQLINREKSSPPSNSKEPKARSETKLKEQIRLAVERVEATAQEAKEKAMAVEADRGFFAGATGFASGIAASAFVFGHWPLALVVGVPTAILYIAHKKKLVRVTD